jgi:ribosomal protein S2
VRARDVVREEEESGGREEQIRVEGSRPSQRRHRVVVVVVIAAAAAAVAIHVVAVVDFTKAAGGFDRSIPYNNDSNPPIAEFHIPQQLRERF